MRTALLLFAAMAAATAHADVFLIGNSLTSQTHPAGLPGFAGYHMASGRTLPHIYANPAGADVAGSLRWDVALASQQYDFVTVQPFHWYEPYTGSEAADAAAISAWMTLQPSATFVVHTSWPRHDSFDAVAPTIISHADAVIDALRAAHPGQTIYRDRAVDALMLIRADVAAGVAPFLSFTDIYVDDIHLTNGSGKHAADHGEGRYLMHNVLRAALGEPLDTSFMPAIAPATRDYLNGVVARATAVPETSQLAMGAAAALASLAAVAYRRWR